MGETKNIGRYAFLWKYARQYRGLFCLAELCLIVQSVGRISLPFILSLFINIVLVEQDTSKVTFFVFVFAAILITYMVATYAYLQVWTKLYNKFVHNLRLQVFDKVLYSMASYLTDMNSGDIVNRIQNDTRTFLDIILRNVFHPFNNAITIISVIFIIAFINIWLGLLTVLLVVLPILLSKLFAKKLQKLGTTQRNSQGNYLGWLNQILGGTIFVRLFFDKKQLASEFDTRQADILRTQKEVDLKSFFVNNFSQFVSLVLLMSLYFVAFFLIKYQGLSIGMLIAVISYIAIVSTALNYTIGAYLELATRKVNIDKVRELVSWMVRLTVVMFLSHKQVLLNFAA